MSVLDKLIEEAAERAGYMTLLAKMTDSGPGKNVAQGDADRMSRFATGMILARAELNEARSSTDAREFLHAKCDCVPDLGPAHCHLCGNDRGAPVPWPECSAVAPVVTVDGLQERIEDTLAYYQCRETNPKADHPSMGYHAFSDAQREHLKAQKADAAAEIVRMMLATPPAQARDEWETASTAEQFDALPGGLKNE